MIEYPLDASGPKNSFCKTVIIINSIFTGMLLVFLNFHLNINSSKIGLIPDFLGYYYILKGLTELDGLSGHFSVAAPYTRGMIAFSSLCYAMDLFGISSLIVVGIPLIFVLGVTSSIISLVISYNIILGIKDIEIFRGQALNSRRLHSAWKLMAFFSLLPYALLFFPPLDTISTIIGFIIAIHYLYTFNTTKLLFNEQNLVL